MPRTTTKTAKKATKATKKATKKTAKTDEEKLASVKKRLGKIKSTIKGLEAVASGEAEEIDVGIITTAVELLRSYEGNRVRFRKRVEARIEG